MSLNQKPNAPVINFEIMNVAICRALCTNACRRVKAIPRYRFVTAANFMCLTPSARP